MTSNERRAWERFREFNGETVRFDINQQTGFVSGCSRWEWIDEMATAGIVRKTFYRNCYGNVDFHLNDKERIQ